MDLLQDALEKVTYEMASTIKRGQEITLNEKYTLYLYEAGQSLVIVETEDWKEIYWVQYNPENKAIDYGGL